MSTILQHDAAARLVDAISSACNDESVRATLQTEFLTDNDNNTDANKDPRYENDSLPYDNNDDVDEFDINNPDTSFASSSLNEYAGSDEPSPTDSTPPLPLARVRPALTQLTAMARLIDRLTASYDVDDARDLLEDLNAWHSFEDYTETIDTLYDRYRTVLYEFAEAAAAVATGQSPQEEDEPEGDVSADTYRDGMQALARVLRGSCDPLPYRLRQVHTALVGSAGGQSKSGQLQQRRGEVRSGEEARVLLRAANDRCIEEADDFLAYYVTMRKLFLHLVASEAKAVMVMAVALQHSGVPHYIQPADIIISRQLLAEQDAFLDRIIPGPVARLAEHVLTQASPTSDSMSPAAAGVEVILRTHNTGGSDSQVRPSAAGEGLEVVCAQAADQPFVWTVEAAQPLPTQDGAAVGRYTFHIRSGLTPSAYLVCDDMGNIDNGAGEAPRSTAGTWRIVAVQVDDVLSDGKALTGQAIPVAFRLQYRSADVSSRGKGHDKWLASVGDGGRLGLRDLEGESQDFLFDISPVKS